MQASILIFMLFIKFFNLEKLREAERHAPIPESPHTTAEIDAYTESIQKFLQNVINEAVP